VHDVFRADALVAVLSDARIELYAIAAALVLLAVILAYNKPRVLRVGFLLVATSPEYNTFLHVPHNARAAAPAIVLLLMFARRRREPIIAGPAFRGSIAFAAIGLALLPVATDPGRGIADILLLVVVLWSTWELVSRSTLDELRQAVFVFGAALTGGSVVICVLHGRIPSALLAGRWTGLLANPNTLGILAAITIVSCRPRTRLWWVTLAVSGIAVYESGSRASALALLFGLIIVVLRRFPAARRAILAGAFAVSVPLVVASLHSTDFKTYGLGTTSVFRAVNSRAVPWDQGVAEIRDRPLTGYGAGDAPEEVANGFLLVLVEIGVLGLIPLSFLLLDTKQVLLASDNVLKPIYVVLIVEGVFESWYFNPGSIDFIILLMISLKLVSLRRLPSATSPLALTVWPK